MLDVEKADDAWDYAFKNVSEDKLDRVGKSLLRSLNKRHFRLAQKLHATGRTDLRDLVFRGEMKTATALRLAEGRPGIPPRYVALKRAWNLASPEDRRKLLLEAAANGADMKID
jgi:hypothetical protein